MSNISMYNGTTMWNANVTEFNVTQGFELVTVSENVTINSTIVNTTAGDSITTATGFKQYVWYVNNVTNYGYLFLALVGILGNVIIVMLMRRPDYRGKSTSVLFTALAVSDILFTVNSIVGSLRSNRVISIKDKYNIHALTWTINRHISNWLLAAITVERVMSVAFPIRMKEQSTTCAALIAVLITCAISIAVNAPVWCLFRVYTLLDMNWLFYVDLVNGFVVPFVVMVIGSTYILVTLKLRRLQTSGTQLSSTTRILLAANLAFLVTMLPRHVLAFFYTDEVLEEHYFLQVIFWFLQESNSVLNFYVYILAGTKFREDLKDMLSLKRSAEFNFTTVNTRNTEETNT